MKYLALAVFTLFVTVACTSAQPEVDITQSEPELQQPIISGLVNQGWQDYEENGFQFEHPVDWQVQSFQTQNPFSTAAKWVVELQSTDKQVVLSGIAPEDYYIRESDESRINTDKYAASYIAIRVLVYDDSLTGETDWREIFDNFYAGSVEEFNRFIVYGQPGLNAVKASKLSGVLPGAERFFVSANGRLYDVALFFQGVDELEARSTFKTFVTLFNF